MPVGFISLKLLINRPENKRTPKRGRKKMKRRGVWGFLINIMKTKAKGKRKSQGNIINDMVQNLHTAWNDLFWIIKIKTCKMNEASRPMPSCRNHQ